MNNNQPQTPTENWKKKLAKMFKRATCYNEVEQFISDLLARREREVDIPTPAQTPTENWREGFRERFLVAKYFNQDGGVVSFRNFWSGEVEEYISDLLARREEMVARNIRNFLQNTLFNSKYDWEKPETTMLELLEQINRKYLNSKI